MRTLLTVTLNRRMLRGNWSSVRGAAPVGLGAFGGHDARLQRLAGWLASSLAYSLCMLFSFHLSCILIIHISFVREPRARGRRLMAKTQQLLLVSESGATLSATHYWQRWGIFPQVLIQIHMQVNTFHEQRVKDIKSSHQVFLQEQIKFYQKVWK